jgi:hypothetical protein
MFKAGFPRNFLLLGLALASALCASKIHAQDINANPRMALDATRMIESPLSKVYRARVLLEDYRNWPQAYELLRDVLKNDSTLNPVAIKKISKAADQVKGYLPGKWIARNTGGRHLIRPFLEASYLLNEALMDSRIAINTSSDSEILFVEQLLKSYFFPGNEANGIIEFPSPDTYAFDLYALNAENIAAARREASDDAGAPATSISASNDSSAAASAACDPQSLPCEAASVELYDRDLSQRYNVANGFISDIIDGGVAISEITKEVQGLIKRYEVPNRVHNRYLPAALLLQSIVDPGTALLDPQLQAFLKGVRLKVALGQANGSARSDILALKEMLGTNAVIEKDGETIVRLGYLIEKQKNNGHLKSGLELSLKDAQGTGRSILYAVSTLTGEEQMMLRTLQAAATIARDADRVQKIAQGVSTALPALAKLQTLGSVSLQSLLKALPAAAQAVNEMARVANSGVAAAGLRSIAAVLKGSVWIQNLGVKASATLGPQATKLLNTAKNSKYVKNGTATGVLTLAVAATQITVGVIEYRATEDEGRKNEIYVDTLSRVGATVSYMLPVVGWGAAALDLGHAFLGVPVETADIFRAYSWAVGESTYLMMGTNGTKVEMDNLGAGMNIPRNDIFFTRWGKPRDTSVLGLQNALTQLRAEVQGTALAQMTLIYIAHRSFASKANYNYGEILEGHFRSYLNNRKAALETEKKIQEKIADELRLNDLQANGGAEGSKHGGAEGSVRSA